MAYNRDKIYKIGHGPHNTIEKFAVGIPVAWPILRGTGLRY
jgi:hypothetical protein